MAALYTPSFFQPQNINGVPLAGAKLFFYQTGTTTPITVYQDSGLTTPHANPVVADASGIFAPIYTSSVQFKTVLKTSADVTVQTVDPVFGDTGALTSTDNAIARFDGTTGALQNSAITIDDAGIMSISAQQLTYTNATQFGIRAGTLDGADTSQAQLCGGGGAAITRGAFIVCHGNESGTPGRIRIAPGSTATGANPIGLEGNTDVTGTLKASSLQTAAVVECSTAASLTLRPNPGSATGQTQIATNGNMTVDGSLTATSFAGSAASLTNIGTPIAGLAVGSVGSYAFCRASGSVSAGSTTAGSGLTYTGASGDTNGGNPGGTWRCMGSADVGSNGSLTSLFLRTA